MIVERSILPKCNRPQVFLDIMANEARRRAFPKDGTMSQAQWVEQGVLVRDMKASLRPSAEKCLRNNVDKGNAQ